jgi:hypothetical protein
MSESTNSKSQRIAARFIAGVKACGFEIATVDLSEFTLEDLDTARAHWKSAIAPFRDDYIFKIGESLPLSVEIRWKHYVSPSQQHAVHADQFTSRLISRRVS